MGERLPLALAGPEEWKEGRRHDGGPSYLLVTKGPSSRTCPLARNKQTPYLHALGRSDESNIHATRPPDRLSSARNSDSHLRGGLRQNPALVPASIDFSFYYPIFPFPTPCPPQNTSRIEIHPRTRTPDCDPTPPER
ncbi:hypothetical protein NUW54_g10973 [Trametes sanguinea]|uniref:Uncharacterized protein n=1 Tax=Trametes sanguinea TaxID=158606 RepID=A0ACC1NQ04_9APHY|nr:hypothetical protein NUW54_g10973 [Trametes sanguinea]